MFERFTDRARKVMLLASQEAQRLNHAAIDTEHILLGVVKEGAGVGANVLKNMGVDLSGIRLEADKLARPRTTTVGKLPQTPQAKKVIEYAIYEARGLGHHSIGTEHLVLGLVRAQEGVAAGVLKNLGLKLDRVRQEVVRLLGPIPVASGAETSTDMLREAIDSLVAARSRALAEGNEARGAQITEHIDRLRAILDETQEKGEP